MRKLVPPRIEEEKEEEIKEEEEEEEEALCNTARGTTDRVNEGAAAPPP